MKGTGVGMDRVCLAAVLLVASAAPGIAAGDTRLADAAMRRDLAAVRTLIGQKVDVNAPGVDGTPALHWIVRVDDVPTARLLLDAGWRPFVDVVWVVVTPRSAVIERLQAQRGLAPADIEARIAAQTTDEQRRRLADVVIENGGSIEDLRRTVDALWAGVAGTSRPAP